MPALGLHHVWEHTLKSVMLDIFYVAIAVLFFLLCWAFTLACDQL